jgi:hypothetical protein
MAASLMLSAKTIPMIKLPMILTASVAYGNIFVVINKLLIYLSMLPMAPPNPTNNKFLIICCL